MSTNTFSRQIFLALTLVATLAMSVQAQPGRGGFGGGRGAGGPGGGRGGFGGFAGGRAGFGGFGGRTANGAAFALRSDVKKELDISEDQSKELTELSQNGPSIQSVMSDMGVDFRSLRDLSVEERGDLMDDVQSELRKLQAKTDKDVLNVLSKSQRERFTQLRFQYNINNGNLVEAARASDQDLDDDKAEELAQAQRKAQEELRERIAELQKELYEDAIATIMGSSKVNELMGDSFEFDAAAGRPAFGRGGGRGGETGGRPRRPGGNDDGAPPRNRRRGDAEEEDAGNPRRRR